MPNRIPNWLFRLIMVGLALIFASVYFLVWPMQIAKAACPSDDPGCVSWADGKARDFRAGKIRNSGGFLFPKGFRDKADNAYVDWYRRTHKGIDVVPDPLQKWWHDTTTKIKCEMTPAQHGSCMKPSPGSDELAKMRSMAANTTKVAIGCGATALIASVEKSGLPNTFTMGTGAASCMFGIVWWQTFHKGEPLPAVVVSEEQE